ncbi:MAG: HDOD domain-containing protein [Gammaproteobacteria bacterium]|nr:HDOD domain-containing protein [Gammaproteobacteria bacterium]
MIRSIEPSELPSPPQASLSVLRACSDDSADYAEITKFVTNDPQLTAEVLRMVNSAFYAITHEISSISQAISVIGVKSLRNLCLCLSVKEVFSGSTFDSDFLNEFWADSVFRAVAAKYIGNLYKKDPDECFTAGLLQDLGLLVLFYLEPDKLSNWQQLRQTSPSLRSDFEKTVFGYSHTEVFNIIGEQWSLPESIISAVKNHHQCEKSAIVDTYAILNAADWLAYVMASDQLKISLDLCKLQLQNNINFSGEEVDTCLTKISPSIQKAANALGILIDDMPEYNDLLKKSNIKLAQDNLEIQELNWRLQETIKERDRLSLELDNELALATEVQESLLPDATDLPVHGFNIPAKQLSGDFYDYQKVADGSIIFCLADVSGKGVNASLLMVKTSSLFHCLGKFIFDLQKLVSVINNELVETSIRGMFVTFVCGKYFPKTGKLTIINAGHPPAFIISDSGSIKINSSTFPLGIIRDTEFTSESFLLKNSMLYVFSDGLNEAEIDGKKVEIDGVLRYFKEIYSLPVSDQIDHIRNEFSTARAVISDDVTVLVVNGH